MPDYFVQDAGRDAVKLNKVVLLITLPSVCLILHKQDFHWSTQEAETDINHQRLLRLFSRLEH